MITKHSAENYKDPLPGIKQKTLVFGERTLMVEFVLNRDSILPDHSHPYEQTGYLVRGRLLLRMGEEQFEAAAGDSWCIPMNVTHRARAIEDSVAVEVFSPVRKDYLPKDRAAT